ncbi:MAG: hypothetical protein KBT88_00435 [Gammaproteobacteria bacterium]|nr:hypothetical protein [Gammaproteobacteria bacterium]MBQ0838220.1 hypothetical protein [Gammaproteobacteria bacterium]
MNIGLPGAGIGGLYYLLCTSLMPFKELFLTLTVAEHKFRYRLVFTQVSIAVGIVIGLVAMYQVASNVLGLDLSLAAGMDGESQLFYATLPVLISLGLLLLILMLVEVAAFFQKRKAPARS